MRLPDYTVTGEGRVTVFLLHGIYGAKEYWRNQTERLVGRGYRDVAWDAPGSGHYPWAENPAEFNRAFLGFLDRRFPPT